VPRIGRRRATCGGTVPMDPCPEQPGSPVGGTRSPGEAGTAGAPIRDAPAAPSGRGHRHLGGHGIDDTVNAGDHVRRESTLSRMEHSFLFITLRSNARFKRLLARMNLG
jgi:hypothetical protein